MDLCEHSVIFENIIALIDPIGYFAISNYLNLKIIVVAKNIEGTYGMKGYINSTDLCNIFNKKIVDWTNKNNTVNMINEFKKLLHSDIELVKYIQHEIKEINGMYIHPLLLPHIISWISPYFAYKISISNLRSNKCTEIIPNNKPYIEHTNVITANSININSTETSSNKTNVTVVDSIEKTNIQQKVLDVGKNTVVLSSRGNRILIIIKNNFDINMQPDSPQYTFMFVYETDYNNKIITYLKKYPNMKIILKIENVSYMLYQQGWNYGWLFNELEKKIIQRNSDSFSMDLSNGYKEEEFIKDVMISYNKLYDKDLFWLKAVR